MSPPRISVLIVSYNMAREIPRTVASFLPPFQTGLRADEVEVIVLENGSPHPIPDSVRDMWPATVRYVNLPNPRPSPARALNIGARLARADVICPVIDGARMASPGLLEAGLDALGGTEDYVASLGLHLGPDRQSRSAPLGYDQSEEDALLDGIDWYANGYDLFRISALAGSAAEGWFGRISESNAPILSKAFFDAIGGFDEAFDLPGGGIVNLDFHLRAVARARLYAVLFGEATFHQYHGGVTTSGSIHTKVEGQTEWERYTAQYAAIRGEPFKVSRRHATLMGRFRPAIAPIVDASRMAAAPNVPPGIPSDTS